MRIPRRKPIYPFGDNDALYFGTSYDVGIYWDGTQLVFNPVAAGHETMSIAFAAGVTTIYGGQNAGDNLFLFANAVDTRGFIKIEGAGHITLNSDGTLKYYENGVYAMQVSYVANVTTIEGGGVANDDLTLKANSSDALPTIILEGAGDVAINPHAGSFLKYGTHVGTGDVVCNGHIIIEDSAGAQHKLMTTA